MKRQKNDLYVLYQDGEQIAACKTYGRAKALRRFSWLLYKILSDEMSFCDESATALANRFEISGRLWINGIFFTIIRLEPWMREARKIKTLKIKKL